MNIYCYYDKILDSIHKVLCKFASSEYLKLGILSFFMRNKNKGAHRNWLRISYESSTNYWTKGVYCLLTLNILKSKHRFMNYFT